MTKHSTTGISPASSTTPQVYGSIPSAAAAFSGSGSNSVSGGARTSVGGTTLPGVALNGGASPLGKKITTDSDGKTTCLCSDGVTYVNCGRNCDCCDNIKKKVKGESQVPSWTTISCPCSSYAVLNIAGDVECEMDFLNSKHRLKAVVLKNHTIDGVEPRKRDQWICHNNSKTPCSQGSIKWDTLHVVDVESVVGSSRTSLHNSKMSTFNCYIPKSTLTEYASEEIGVIDQNNDELIEFLKDNQGIDISNQGESFNNVLLFDKKEQADLWNSTLGDGTSEASEFIDERGTTKYFPGKYYPKQKLITSCHINNVDVLGVNIASRFNYDAIGEKGSISNASRVLELVIKGENKPIVDISIKDSYNRSVIKRKLKGIVINGEYRLKHEVPRLGGANKQETYNITITPSADTKYYYNKDTNGYQNASKTSAGVLRYSVKQFSDIKASCTNSLSSLANTNTTVTSSINFSGAAYSNSTFKTPITRSVTVSRASGSQNYYAIENSLTLENSLVKPNAIKRTITGQKDQKELECKKSFELATMLDAGDVAKFNTGTNPQSLPLQPGMSFSSEVKKTREISKSINLDNKEAGDCDEEDILYIFTNKFELIDGTEELFSGMIVNGVSASGQEFSSTLESVDCSKSITLESHHEINNGVKLVFKHVAQSTVDRIEGDVVYLNNCVRLPNKSELTFVRNFEGEGAKGHLSIDKSGASAVEITTTFDGFGFGRHLVELSLNPDLIVTNKPPAHDQHLVVERDEALFIDFLKFNNNLNLSDMVITAALPSSGTLEDVRAIARYLKYIPATGFTGHDKFTFTTSDGVNSSEEKTIFITIK